MEQFTSVPGPSQDDFNSLSNNVANIGTVVTGTNATDLTVANATSVAISSVSLSAGTWIIVAGHQWTSGFSQIANVSLRKDNTTIAGTTVRYTGDSGGGANISIITKLTAQSTITFNAYQSSGTSKTASYVSLIAVRIK